MFSDESILFIIIKKLGVCTRDMRELHSLMKERRSIRNFIEAPVSKEIIDRIILAAYYAPTAARRQGFKIIVIDNPQKKASIRDICEQGERRWVYSRPKAVKDSILNLPDFSFKKTFLTKAPILLVISTDPNNPQIPYAIESCWLAIAYMLLEIENSGLGTLTYTPSVCFTDRRLELNQVLNLPDEEYVQTILPIGHFSKKPDRVTLPVEHKVHYNCYGNIFF